jgi:hypothetical protein
MEQTSEGPANKANRDPNKWRLRRNTQIKDDTLFDYRKGWLSDEVNFKYLQNEIEELRSRYHTLGVRKPERRFE